MNNYNLFVLDIEAFEIIFVEWFPYMYIFLIVLELIRNTKHVSHYYIEATLTAFLRT